MNISLKPYDECIRDAMMSPPLLARSGVLHCISLSNLFHYFAQPSPHSV